MAKSIQELQRMLRSASKAAEDYQYALSDKIRELDDRERKLELLEQDLK